MPSENTKSYSQLKEYWVRFKTEDGNVRHLIMGHPMKFKEEGFISINENGKAKKYLCETVDEFWVLEPIIESPPAPEYPSHNVLQHITEVFLRAAT